MINGIPTRIMWHDTRLDGVLPVLDDAQPYDVTDNDSLSEAVDWIRQYAGSVGRLSRLDIVCHGLTRYGEDDEQQASTDVGGYGLAMTGDNINLGNVYILGRLNGLVDTIVIYACAASRNSAVYSPGLIGNGRELMYQIVQQTGAYVLASDYEQTCYYEPYIHNKHWNGNLNGFDTDGGVTPWGLHDWMLV